MRVFRRTRGGLGELPGDLDRQSAGSARPPKQKRNFKTVSLGIVNGRTVAGSKIVTPGRERGYLEFQNQSAASDMRLNFGNEASADTGIVVPAGGTHIWDIAVPENGLSVFCVDANQPYAVCEAL